MSCRRASENSNFVKELGLQQDANDGLSNSPASLCLKCERLKKTNSLYQGEIQIYLPQPQQLS